MALVDYFLKIDGVPGESQDHKHKDEIQVLSFSFGESQAGTMAFGGGGGAGKVQMSDFGFAMAMHPHEPDTVFIVPLEADTFRCTPDGRLRVYRTRDGARSWQPMTRGLPQKDAFETVLRDALCTDTLPRAGVYFGTRSGKLYGSPDDGETWELIRDGLPPIVCVKAAVLA